MAACGGATWGLAAPRPRAGRGGTPAAACGERVWGAAAHAHLGGDGSRGFAQARARSKSDRPVRRNQERWDLRFAELGAFRQEHGDSNVPRGWKENVALAEWVTKQRAHRKQGTLGEERVARLEAAGFEFEPYAAEWEKHLKELGAFKEEHGHCNVPQGSAENLNLAKWASKQRHERKQGKMGADRMARLGAMGFEWELKAHVEWEERFGELGAFKEEHGHCNVPREWEENPALGLWVSTQRANIKADLMPKDQVELLNAIGFEWVLREVEAPWERRYRELEAFRERFGHCDVPEGWAENGKLAYWVGMQRKYRRTRKRKTLTDERRKRLDALRFSWEGYESGKGGTRL